MVLVAYRHGLRAAELVTLCWDAIDFAHGRLHVRRLKGGSESVHPLSGRELRALRRDPPVGGHSCHGGMIPRRDRAVSH
jgi:integrase